MNTHKNFSWKMVSDSQYLGSICRALWRPDAMV